MSRLALILVPVALLALTACQSNEPVEPANDNAATSNSEPREATPAAEPRRSERRRPAPEPVAQDQAEPAVDPSREIPRLEGNLQSEGYGMTMIIDGSSPQAFADSLEMIAADSSAEQYRQLDSAIRYLNTYSLGTRNLEDFYRTVDGMTAEEVIEMAQNRNRR